MRRLLILRHSKAERGAAGISDKVRELTPEGRDNAAAMGRYMARHGFKPDGALVSPAVRTRETWDGVQPSIGRSIEPRFDERIYDATLETLLDVVKDGPAKAGTLILVGHNPGLHELAVFLTATGDIDTRERLREKFPTSGLAILDFALENWRDVHPRSGRLERFVSPKTISTATK